MRIKTRAVKRVGWTRLSRPGDKCSARWRHDASGWEVVHCGHPTANYPYYAIDPEHPDRAVVTATGHGFRRLAIALEVVDKVVAGELPVTNENCGARTRIVLGTAGGCLNP